VVPETLADQFRRVGALTGLVVIIACALLTFAALRAVAPFSHDASTPEVRALPPSSSTPITPVTPSASVTAINGPSPAEEQRLEQEIATADTQQNAREAALLRKELAAQRHQLATGAPVTRVLQVSGGASAGGSQGNSGATAPISPPSKSPTVRRSGAPPKWTARGGSGG
jgi:hypothetical protein